MKDEHADSEGDEQPAAQLSPQLPTATTTQAGVVYWLTGLPGTGKTTLARLLGEELRRRGRSVVRLDGNTLRAQLFPAVGYTQTERLDLGLRYGRLCALLAAQGLDVVCATISLFPEVWEQNRRELTRYREILLQAPDDLRERRKQDLIRRARRNGEPFVGQGQRPAEPPRPDARLWNDAGTTPAALLQELLGQLGERLPGPRKAQP